MIGSLLGAIDHGLLIIRLSLGVIDGSLGRVTGLLNLIKLTLVSLLVRASGRVFSRGLRCLRLCQQSASPNSCNASRGKHGSLL